MEKIIISLFLKNHPNTGTSKYKTETLAIKENKKTEHYLHIQKIKDITGILGQIKNSDMIEGNVMLGR